MVSRGVHGGDVVVGALELSELLVAGAVQGGLGLIALGHLPEQTYFRGAYLGIAGLIAQGFVQDQYILADGVQAAFETSNLVQLSGFLLEFFDSVLAGKSNGRRVQKDYLLDLLS